ncbi:hypothetical protein [Legionella rowbothamii]|uniref:hypothetical protein n=1 Tax=Legionella rowbothamii TaxID=96229 RepID=UPI001055F701|nr:hypothetical protein [Legionella rowbothamii]
MNKEWFEMKDIRRKKFDSMAWIPLRAAEYKINIGTYGYEGYQKEFFGVGSIAIPYKQIEEAKRLDWTDIGRSSNHSHTGWFDDKQYFPAEVYKDYQGNVDGIHLVLEQTSHDERHNIWHLNQDLVLSLGIVREGNSWVDPMEDYAVVARIRTDESNKTVVLEIKAHYLKDYLCARDMALYMTQYCNRVSIYAEAPPFTWSVDSAQVNTESGKWQGGIREIHEGGGIFGSKIGIFQFARIDVEEEDDIPSLSETPTQENTSSASWEKSFEGKKLYYVLGEYWRNEVILPSKTSAKVRGDTVQNTCVFIIDVDGSTARGMDLIDSGKWLWFKPEVIMALCNRRGGSLKFYTAQTGEVSCSYKSGVNFGLNHLSLINVFAKDIGNLPEWQQKIWAGFNVVPDGGVGHELLASQVRGQPATTQAPEEYLFDTIKNINECSQEKLGILLFKDHDAIHELLPRIHRFRSTDEQSFYALAKDLARLIVDCLDIQPMKKFVSPPKSETWGSIKYLENLLASKYDRNRVREVTASIVGVYELRHADAHLPTSNIEEAFKLVGIDTSRPYVDQGFQMLYNVVASLAKIAEALELWD